ncbi:unnamed protein product [Amoebophrya sp. A120]|nr:unnamed protein product [Amoebophrya sp. A120]|eukprot:GSA120T00020276001.1
MDLFGSDFVLEQEKLLPDLGVDLEVANSGRGDEGVVGEAARPSPMQQQVVEPCDVNLSVDVAQEQGSKDEKYTTLGPSTWYEQDDINTEELVENNRKNHETLVKQGAVPPRSDGAMTANNQVDTSVDEEHASRTTASDTGAGLPEDVSLEEGGNSTRKNNQSGSCTTTSRSSSAATVSTTRRSPAWLSEFHQQTAMDDEEEEEVVVDASNIHMLAGGTVSSKASARVVGGLHKTASCSLLTAGSSSSSARSSSGTTLMNKAGAASAMSSSTSLAQKFFSTRSYGSDGALACPEDDDRPVGAAAAFAATSTTFASSTTAGEQQHVTTQGTQTAELYPAQPVVVAAPAPPPPPVLDVVSRLLENDKSLFDLMTVAMKDLSAKDGLEWGSYDVDPLDELVILDEGDDDERGTKTMQSPGIFNLTVRSERPAAPPRPSDADAERRERTPPIVVAEDAGAPASTDVEPLDSTGGHPKESSSADDNGTESGGFNEDGSMLRNANGCRDLECKGDEVVPVQDKIVPNSCNDQQAVEKVSDTVKQTVLRLRTLMPEEEEESEASFWYWKGIDDLRRAFCDLIDQRKAALVKSRTNRQAESVEIGKHSTAPAAMETNVNSAAAGVVPQLRTAGTDSGTSSSKPVHQTQGAAVVDSGPADARQGNRSHGSMSAASSTSAQWGNSSAVSRAGDVNSGSYWACPRGIGGYGSYWGGPAGPWGAAPGAGWGGDPSCWDHLHGAHYWNNARPRNTPGGNPAAEQGGSHSNRPIGADNVSQQGAAAPSSATLQPDQQRSQADYAEQNGAEGQAQLSSAEQREDVGRPHLLAENEEYKIALEVNAEGGGTSAGVANQGANKPPLRKTGASDFESLAHEHAQPGRAGITPDEEGCEADAHDCELVSATGGATSRNDPLSSNKMSMSLNSSPGLSHISHLTSSPDRFDPRHGGDNSSLDISSALESSSTDQNKLGIKKVHFAIEDEELHVGVGVPSSQKQVERESCDNGHPVEQAASHLCGTAFGETHHVRHDGDHDQGPGSTTRSSAPAQGQDRNPAEVTEPPAAKENSGSAISSLSQIGSEGLCVSSDTFLSLSDSSRGASSRTQIDLGTSRSCADADFSGGPLGNTGESTTLNACGVPPIKKGILKPPSPCSDEARASNAGDDAEQISAESSAGSAAENSAPAAEQQRQSSIEAPVGELGNSAPTEQAAQQQETSTTAASQSQYGQRNGGKGNSYGYGPGGSWYGYNGQSGGKMGSYGGGGGGYYHHAGSGPHYPHHYDHYHGGPGWFYGGMQAGYHHPQHFPHGGKMGYGAPYHGYGYQQQHRSYKGYGAGVPPGGNGGAGRGQYDQHGGMGSYGKPEHHAAQEQAEGEGAREGGPISAVVHDESDAAPDGGANVCVSGDQQDASRHAASATQAKLNLATVPEQEKNENIATKEQTA